MSGNLTPEKFDAMCREWGKIAREYRRSNLTFVVVDGHEGPMTTTTHPTDGRFVECSYLQALAIHKEQPLRLVKVESVDRAHFEWALPFGTFCPLCPPPYELPPGRDDGR